MRPVATDETNFTYRLGGGTEANDLPCRRDASRVFSAWEPEPNDLLELSVDYPRVVLSIIWPNKLGCSIKVGDDAVHEEDLEAEFIHPDGERYWQYTRVLTDREAQILKDGARIEIMVDLISPPPVSLQLA